MTTRYMTTRREPIREAIAPACKRRNGDLLWRPITVTKAQLDQPEERGYLEVAHPVTDKE